LPHLLNWFLKKEKEYKNIFSFFLKDILTDVLADIFTMRYAGSNGIFK
jgi:hypothetical protein